MRQTILINRLGQNVRRIRDLKGLGTNFLRLKVLIEVLLFRQEIYFRTTLLFVHKSRSLDSRQYFYFQLFVKFLGHKTITFNTPSRSFRLKTEFCRFLTGQRFNEEWRIFLVFFKRKLLHFYRKLGGDNSK